MKTNFLYATGLVLMGLVACNNNKAEREKEAEQATSQAIDSMLDVQERNRVLDSIEFSASGHTLEQAPMPEPEKHSPPAHKPKTEPKDHTATKTETAAPVPAPSPTPE